MIASLKNAVFMFVLVSGLSTFAHALPDACRSVAQIYNQNGYNCTPSIYPPSTIVYYHCTGNGSSWDMATGIDGQCHVLND